MRIERVKSRYIYAFVDSSLLDALCEAFHGFERGARRKARGAAAENRGRALESEKTWEMFFRAETPKQWRGDRPGRLCGMFCLQK
jgi:hypothetical protein